MANRFDFEQSLLGYFRVEDDVKDVLTFLLDKSDLKGNDLDKVANMLLGITELYSVKSDALFDMFEELVGVGDLGKK
jgi:hypothetical protein